MTSPTGRAGIETSILIVNPATGLPLARRSWWSAGGLTIGLRAGRDGQLRAGHVRRLVQLGATQAEQAMT